MSLIFLLRRQPFDFLFAINRRVGVEEALVVSESRQVVTAGEAGNQFALVLEDAAAEVSGDARV
jgi:hypothetical protein